MSFKVNLVVHDQHLRQKEGGRERGLEVWLKRKSSCFASVEALSSNHSPTKKKNQSVA